MMIIPAIDLLDGKAVRLYKGDYGAVSSYSDDPVDLARSLADAGIRRLHLVDLDAAKGEGRTNRDIMTAICKAVDCDIEVGGGIRSTDDVLALKNAGIHWLIVGTALVRNPDAVASWNQLAPGSIVAGIDAYDGDVKVAGWLDGTPLKDIDLGKQARALGCAAIVYTNIARDGTLQGPDFERTVAMADASGLPVILSGGVSSMADLVHASTLADKGVIGCITGKALYEGRIDLRKALAEVSQH